MIFNFQSHLIIFYNYKSFNTESFNTDIVLMDKFGNLWDLGSAASFLLRLMGQTGIQNSNTI